MAVVGSGPAGLAAAQQLARAGHAVTVFEKADRIGGLLRYGIPDFKMEKHGIDRRIEQMQAEGVEFVVNTPIRSLENMRPAYQAVVLAMGAEQPRDLTVPGRELKGIHYAMDFLPQQNKRVAGDTVPDHRRDSGDRQARDHHRRRRHRSRLSGHLAPAEGGVGASVRDHAHASGGPLAFDAMASVALAVAHGELA